MALHREGFMGFSMDLLDCFKKKHFHLRCFLPITSLIYSCTQSDKFMSDVREGERMLDTVKGGGKVVVYF